MKKWKLFSLLAVFCAGIFASCSGDDGEEPTGPVEKGLFLKASSTVLTVGDQTTLSVFKDGVDVTADSKTTLFMKNKQTGDEDVYEGTTFSSSTTGEFVFYAYYGTVQSNELTIRVLENSIAVPDDSQKDKWDGFVRRTLGLQFTSIGCSNCPYVIAAIHHYKEAYDDVLFAAAHVNFNGPDPMTTTASAGLTDYFVVQAWPTFLIGLNNSIKNDSRTTTEWIKQNAETFLAQPAKTAIAASVSGSTTSQKVTVNAKIKVNQAGEYRVAAWLLKDGTVAEQNNTTAVDLTGIDIDTHNNAICAISNKMEGAVVKEIGGDLLGGEATTAANTEKVFGYEFNLSGLGIEDLGKCHVYIMVTTPDRTGTTTRYVVDNIIDCPVGGSVAYQYQ